MYLESDNVRIWEYNVFRGVWRALNRTLFGETRTPLYIFVLAGEFDKVEDGGLLASTIRSETPLGRFRTLSFVVCPRNRTLYRHSASAFFSVFILR